VPNVLIQALYERGVSGHREAIWTRLARTVGNPTAKAASAGVVLGQQGGDSPAAALPAVAGEGGAVGEPVVLRLKRLEPLPVVEVVLGGAPVAGR